MSATPEERLKALGIELPDAPKPVGSYVPAVRSGNLIFLSGILPFKEGKLLSTGKVMETVTPDEAASAARVSALNAISILRDYMGGLGKVNRCVKITGYVASRPDFTGQPGVLNGASDLMVDVFGDKGRHARAAIGVPSLPLDSPVEIEFIFEVQD